jgi:hypothetical protein
MSPADHLVPAAIRQLGAAVDVERKGHTERAPYDFAIDKPRKRVVKVVIEDGSAKIEICRRIVPHELGPYSLQFIGKDLRHQIRPVPQ